jgi:DNA-binding Lrp family transcriptional regulator
MPATFYDEAHLVVSAIRVLTHQQTTPPSVEKIGEALGYSREKAGRLCRKLEELEIIEVIEGAYGPRLFVRNHPALETISRDQETDALQDELKKFQASRSQISQKVEAFKAKQDEKQKNLFAELEKKLKAKKEPTDG